MISCPHGITGDCINCEIADYRQILNEVEKLELAVKRCLSLAIERRKGGPAAKVEAQANVIYWPGLGEK